MEYDFSGRRYRDQSEYELNELEKRNKINLRVAQAKHNINTGELSLIQCIALAHNQPFPTAEPKDNGANKFKKHRGRKKKH